MENILNDNTTWGVEANKVQGNFNEINTRLADHKWLMANNSNIVVTKISNGVNITLASAALYVAITPAGGFYSIQPCNIDITGTKMAYLSKAADSDSPLDESVTGNGGNVYIRTAERTAFPNNILKKGFPVIGYVGGNLWSTPHETFKPVKYTDIAAIIADNKYQISKNDAIKVTRETSSIKITVNGENLYIVLAPGGGYYTLANQTVNVASQEIAYLSKAADSDVELNSTLTSAGGNVYIRTKGRLAWSALNYSPNFPVIGFASDINKWEAKYAAFELTIPTDLEKYVEFEQREIIPKKQYGYKNIAEIADFTAKYRKRRQDVTVVNVGDSISVDGGYASEKSDQAYRPPLMTENNLLTKLEEKLRWKEQQYRRYDAMTAEGGTTPVFTSILGGGTASDIEADTTAWGFAIGNNFHAKTRVIDGGTDAGVTFTYPVNMRRCNFIYHTDHKWASSTNISVAEGNGLVEVWNGTAWVEANGYSFSAQESSTPLNDATYGNYYKDVYQKRLKMRSLTDLTAKTITIQNSGAGRFGFWGIEYSPKEFMFTFINAAKGGHNIAKLRLFEEWMVDDFAPDLVLQQCCIINEGCQTGVKSGYEATRTPIDFASAFGTYYDALATTKSYLVLPYIMFVGMQAGIVDETTGEWGVGYIADYGEITIPDFIGHLVDTYVTKNAPVINLFNDFLQLAERKAANEGTGNIYTSAITASSTTGNTFTKDGVHPNDYAGEIAFRLLEPYFNF